MSNTVTIAVIGSVGVIAGAVVGAISGWWSAHLTGRQAVKAARSNRRHQAYESFYNHAADLDEAFTAIGNERLTNIVEPVNPAIKALHRSLNTVTLVGTRRAYNAAGAIYETIWEISEMFAKDSPSDLEPLNVLRTRFHDQMSAFVGAARRDLK